MKKVAIIFILLFSFCNIALSIPTQSTNPFTLTIPASAIPPGGVIPTPTPPPAPGGLGGGAITGITAGAGAAAAGAGAVGTAFFPWWLTGLAAGGAIGVDSPLVPVCLDRKIIQTFLCQNPQNTYLAQAISLEPIKPCPCSKYILIPDTAIANKTSNTIYFKIPTEMRNTQNLVNIKVFQVSTPFWKNEFDGKIYLNTENQEENDRNTQITLQKTTEKISSGIVIKTGIIEINKCKPNQIARLEVSYRKRFGRSKTAREHIYAYLIEFFQ